MAVNCLGVVLRPTGADGGPNQAMTAVWTAHPCKDYEVTFRAPPLGIMLATQPYRDGSSISTYVVRVLQDAQQCQPRWDTDL